MRLIFTGDMAFCRKVGEDILKNKYRLPENIITKFHNADFSLVNLECPLSDSAKPAWNYFTTLKGPAKAINILKDLHVDVASLANNHIADYGKTGFEHTILLLNKHNIKWTGAGWTPEEARTPLIFEKTGQKIGILALAQPEISAAKNGKWGAGVLKNDRAVSQMEKLADQVDIAIAYLHFGVEFSSYCTPGQVKLSRQLIDAGAILVVGHHPHVVQGYEYYKNGFIAYSLGNFVFDMNPGKHKFSRLGLIIEADIEKNRLQNVHITPVNTKHGNTSLLNIILNKEADDYLKTLSAPLKSREILLEKYFFTCRDNMIIHMKAIAHFLRKRKIRSIFDWQGQQFWPQILRLRIDLFRFLFAGDALKYENKKGPPKEGKMACFWRFFCSLCGYIGFGWGQFIKIK